MATKKFFIGDVHKLNTWIRSLHRDEPDPGVIVEKILAELTPHEALTVARLTLRDYVRRTIATPAPTDSPAGQAATDAHSRGASGGPTSPRPSSRIAGIRDQLGPELRRRLAISLPVSDDLSVPYKFLSDCTAADLRFIVHKREQMAAANLNEARHYERILSAVVASGAPTVGSLPEDVLRDVVLS